MKTLLKSLPILLFALFISTTPVKGQAIKILNLATVANSVDETGYFNDFTNFAQKHGYKTVDSIVVELYAENETDIDSFDVYPGFSGQADNVAESFYSATVLHYAVTINIADNGSTVELLKSSGATLLTKAALSGFNSLKFITRGAASGNDATDPNKVWVIFFVYGT